MTPDGTVVCTLEELRATGSRGFRVGEGDWPLRGFVVLQPDGTVRAYENRCPHAGHPLDLLEHRFLTADRGHIVCASHGALFSLDSGLCVAGPCPGRALRPLPASVATDGRVRLAPQGGNGDNPRPDPVPAAPAPRGRPV